MSADALPLFVENAVSQRVGHDLDALIIAETPAPANLTAPTAPLRPYADRPRSARPGLRTMPLDGFHWGGAVRAGLVRAPWVRGDHCLIRVTAGSLRLILPRSHVDHGPGSVLFIPQGTAFATLPFDGVGGQVLLIPASVAEQLPSPLPGRMVVGADVGNALLSDLSALVAQEHDPSASTRVELISVALQRLAATPALDAPQGRRCDTAILLDAFVKLAARELGRGRTVADLAAALGTTAAGVEAACRKQRGCSALQVMYTLRLDRAREMLADKTRPLSEIAKELGFTGTAHLNRAFVAATGRSAEAFRPR